MISIYSMVLKLIFSCNNFHKEGHGRSILPNLSRACFYQNPRFNYTSPIFKMKLPRFVNNLCSKYCPCQFSAEEEPKNDELDEEKGEEENNEASNQSRIRF